MTKLCESDRVGTVYVAPGNGGTEGASEKVTNVPISDGDSAGIVKFCTEKQINFVAVGPEIPLANGLADDLAKVGVACFGPSKVRCCFMQCTLTQAECLVLRSLQGCCDD